MPADDKVAPLPAPELPPDRFWLSKDKSQSPPTDWMPFAYKERRFKDDVEYHRVPTEPVAGAWVSIRQVLDDHKSDMEGADLTYWVEKGVRHENELYVRTAEAITQIDALTQSTIDPGAIYQNAIRAAIKIVDSFEVLHEEIKDTVQLHGSVLIRRVVSALKKLLTASPSNVPTPDELTAAFHRGVDAAMNAIRFENVDELEVEFIKPAFINAIARTCGFDRAAPSLIPLFDIAAFIDDVAQAQLAMRRDDSSSAAMVLENVAKSIRSHVNHKEAVSIEAALSQLRQACWIHTQWMIGRYLMANAEGRADGAEKAQRHRELCLFYVALFRGGDPEYAGRDFPEDYDRLHAESQELTSRMDEAIGFPIKGIPDYDKLGPLFFQQFHEIALRVMGAAMEMALRSEGKG